MKKFLIITLSLFFASQLLAQSYTASPTASKLGWKGEKLTGSHTGDISLKSGELVVKKNSIASGSFVLDMNSITCTDLTDKTTAANLVGHLKSDDFFGVSTYPEAVFTIVSATAVKDGKTTIKGNLTIKGKTHPNEFVATVKQSGKTLTYNANIEVDRSKYDVKYASKSFFGDIGDKVIYDIFKIDLELVLTEK